MNNNLYTYFVSYTFARGNGMVCINRAGKVTTWDDIQDLAHQIGQHVGETSVSVVNFQLLSGPAETASADNHAEALTDLYQRLSRALDHAAADRRSGGYSKESILESLTGHVREARAALGALINH